MRQDTAIRRRGAQRDKLARDDINATCAGFGGQAVGMQASVAVVLKIVEASWQIKETLPGVPVSVNV